MPNVCSKLTKIKDIKFVAVEFDMGNDVKTTCTSIIVQLDATIYSLLYFCKLLYMFRMVTPPIIRSTYNCNYSIWHWSNPLHSKCVEQFTEI